MKFNNLTTKLTKMAGRTGLKLKKYSPEILLVVGITGTVASAVLACRATLRVEEVLDNHEAKIDKITKTWNEVENGERSLTDYSEADRKKDLTVVYAQTAVDFVKLYGPAVTLGAASVVCILGGHRIMKTRNIALVAAYKTVEEGFNAYRRRVIEEYGEEKDYMFKNNLRAETVTDTEVDEDGKPHKVKKTALALNEGTNGYSMYARWFDDSCTEWDKDPEYNFMALRAKQNYFNDLLKIRGHVFLNEVYDSLGMPRTQAGAVVGWVLNEDGDNFIDFGIFDGDKRRARDFVNGYENAILLDFNVDGTIYDKFCG